MPLDAGNVYVSGVTWPAAMGPVVTTVIWSIAFAATLSAGPTTNSCGSVPRLLTRNVTVSPGETATVLRLKPSEATFRGTRRGFVSVPTRTTWGPTTTM